jgi:hypothetical protein
MIDDARLAETIPMRADSLAIAIHKKTPLGLS